MSPDQRIPLQVDEKGYVTGIGKRIKLKHKWSRPTTGVEVCTVCGLKRFENELGGKTYQGGKKRRTLCAAKEDGDE